MGGGHGGCSAWDGGAARNGGAARVVGLDWGEEATWRAEEEEEGREKERVPPQKSQAPTRLTHCGRSGSK